MNKLRYFFDILLLSVNSAAIAGSCIEVLGIPWKEVSENGISSNHAFGSMAETWKMTSDAVLDGGVFWSGLLLFCMMAICLLHRGSRKRTLLCAGACVSGYAFLGFLFGKELKCGLVLALQNAADRFGVYCGHRIPWPDSTQMLGELGSIGEYETLLVTLSVLFLCFPLAMLEGYCWNRDRFFGLITGHILWFSIACTLERFPGFPLLVIGVLGLTGAIVQRDFEASPLAGVQAVGATAVLTGGILGIAYFFLLPELDGQYAEMQTEREEFYRVVNEEWIPGLKNTFSGAGIGTGVDVTGTLNRTNVFSRTEAETYRVTVDGIPQGVLYLKGFVGGIYGKKAWEIQGDQHLEKYYRENDWELPENYGALVNISYEAARARKPDAAAEYIRIEELGGRGSYSIYPYGALLTEEYQVHSDGSAIRRSDSYEFWYRFPAGEGEPKALTGQWKSMERQYRQYVYDSFLAYPEEALPLLTECLKQEDIRTDNVYACALDIMKLLQHQAVYSLDAGRNPAGTDFVEYFLFESHEGYCVHFASAGVLAFRYFGIPARYVTGYVVSPSEFVRNPEGDYTAVLTGKQAHAWAEIYLDEAGWIPVEMTPGAEAFPGDNQELLGELESRQSEEWRTSAALAQENQQSISGEQQSTLPEKPSFSGEPSAEPDEGLPELPFKPQDKKDSRNPEKKQKISEPAEGMEAAGGEIWTESGFGQKVKPWFMAFGMGILWGILFLLGKCLYNMGKHHWHGLLESAGTRKGIWLLYGNLRKALGIAGCSERQAVRGEEFRRGFLENAPEADEREYEIFCAILEKNAFGRTEPSAEEFRMVRELHDRLVNGVYAGAPFYKRLLFVLRRCYVRTESVL